MPTRHHTLVAVLIALFVAPALLAAPVLRDNDNGTVTDLGTGLTWVADPDFIVRAGQARDLVVRRARGLEIVAAMNRGALQNFGRTDWRLPTTRELQRLAQAEGNARLVAAAQAGITRVTGAGRARHVIAWPVAGAAEIDGIGAVAVLATNSAHVKRNADVVGNVVVNDASPGPTLVAGFELNLDRDGSVTGNVAADSVKIDRSHATSGEVAYNDLSKDNSATTGSLSTPLDLPVFGLLPAFHTAAPRPDAADVFVAPFETATLAAGDYGDIEVSDHGTVRFTGGVYDVESLTAVGLPCLAAPCRSFLFAGPTDLRIAGRLATGAFDTLAPESGVSAGDVVLYVGGINGTTGGINEVPIAAFVDQGNTVGATIYAPNGTLKIDRDSTTTGAFFGRDVSVGNNTTVTVQSFFANRAPTADPKSVFTNGAAEITINLSGSDPENEDLTFAIVTGPTQGTLDPIVEQPAPVNPGDPNRTTATVDYTPATANDVEDSFVFKVTDVHGASGQATVLINPPSDPAVTTVVAFDVETGTTTDTPLLITLSGAAPTGTGDLTFAIVGGSGPSSGSLGAITPGSESPIRTASVTYTPNSGFNGSDGFQFEVCGVVSGSPSCDVGDVSIGVQPPDSGEEELAPDQTASTSAAQSVEISLGGLTSGGGAAQAAASGKAIVRLVGNAAFLDGAEIAGNVADADENGFGDNHNALPGSSPVFISAGVDQVGGAGSNGTVRIQIEWDISGLAGIGTIESASVLLHTHRGSVDSLDTSFFAASGGNGTLEDTDFETTATAIPGAVMPVPPLEDMPEGTDGTFSFDVESFLLSAIDADAGFFTVQGRVNETLTGPARGLEVRSSASGNVADFLQPQLAIATPGVVAPPVFEILSLPAEGTLRNSLGDPITVVPYTLDDNLVSYTPTIVGTFSFSYRATFGTTVDTGVVTLFVSPVDCATNPLDCDDGR